jgi:drug/metabolite transporter (DMT)-like permease
MRFAEVLFRAFLFAAYAVLNTAAMAAAKAAIPRLAVGDRKAVFGLMALGGGLYAAVLAVMMILLRDWEASVVMPIAIGATVLTTNLAGSYYYGERLTRRKLAGTFLITLGITFAFIGGTPR